MIDITSDGKDLLESKTFIALDLGETSVSVREGNECVRFVLDFSQIEGGEQQIRSELIDDKSLRLRLVNFNSPFGTTFVEPLNVGVFKSRKLYLMLNVAKIGEKGELRQITLATYLGEEVPNG